eukprot:7644892-Prorocentrum_lima.AAC.1
MQLWGLELPSIAPGRCFVCETQTTWSMTVPVPRVPQCEKGRVSAESQPKSPTKGDQRSHNI